MVKRLQAIALPQYLYRRMVATFIIPVLYGLEFGVLDSGARDLDRQLRHGTWGTCRPATNWPAAKTYCLRSQNVTVEGARYVQIFRSIWEFASHEVTRALCLRVWNSNIVKHKSGIWYAFLLAVSDAEAVLLQDGGLRLCEHDTPYMHLSQSKESWMHCARQLWRRCCRKASAKMLPAVYPPVQEVIDWWCCRSKAAQRTAMLDTVQAHAVNTKGRVARHFQGDCTCQCEYGCPSEDTFQHRLLDCEGTATLRLELGLQSWHIERLRHMGPWVKQVCVWTLPDCVVAELPTVQQGWGLWPNTWWLSRLLATSLKEEVEVHFKYASWKDGRHPLLTQKVAQFEVSQAPELALQAKVVGDAASRSVWEVEVVILCAIIAIMQRQSVCVQGLSAPLAKLWTRIASRRCSNSHLTDMVLQAKDLVRSSGNLDNDAVDSWIVEGNSVKAPFSREVVEELEFMDEISQKMALFCDKMGELYPMASNLSRNHGSWRGGYWHLPKPVMCCDFVGVAFAHRPVLSAEEGSPVSLTLESSLCVASSTKLGSFEPM